MSDPGGVVRRVAELPRRGVRFARRVARGLRRRAGVARDRARSAAASTGVRVRRAAWRTRVLLLARTGVRLRPLVGTVRPDALLVVMCLWRRPERIDAILALLASQEGCPPLRLVLWNNARDLDAVYRDAIRRFGAKGALSSVELHTSRVNVGGIARFVLARQLTEAGAHTPFVMLDDDQDVTASFVADLVAAYRPRTYAGVWAFVIRGSYWERDEAVPGAGGASYVGTGGSVCDADIVRLPGFFADLPAEYGFIEDLWASVVAARAGWRLDKVDTPWDFVKDEIDQHLSMVHVKPRFWDLLQASRPTDHVERSPNG